jgi:polynucleotide 5'-kinase involved in rRNA processing
MSGDHSISSEKLYKGINLENAIASSRLVEKKFSLNVHLADETVFKAQASHSKHSPIDTYVKNLNKSNLNSLPKGGAESTIAQSEDFEGMSSSRDTEYTISPQMNQNFIKKVHFG